MRSDDDVYSDIASILFKVAPGGACKVIMRARLSQGKKGTEKRGEIYFLEK